MGDGDGDGDGDGEIEIELLSSSFCCSIVVGRSARAR